MNSRARQRPLLTVFILACLVRVAFLLWGFTGWHVVDKAGLSTGYFRQGYGIAAGYGYIGVAPGERGREYLIRLEELIESERISITSETAAPLPDEGITLATLHPPGMPLLIAGAHRLWGGPVDVPIQCVGIVADSFAAVLVGWVVCALFSRRVGFLSGLLYAGFPPMAYVSALSRMPVGLLALFVVASLACLVRAARCTGWKWLGWVGLCGFIIGMGSYLRPDYALLPSFMFFGLWVYTRRFSRSVAGALIAQALVFATLFPWALRNYNYCERWVFSSTSVGATLITGLGEFKNSWGFGHTDDARRAQAAEQGLDSPWLPEADAYFRKLFIESVRADPFGYVKSVVRRVPLVVAPPYQWGFLNPWKTQSFSEARETAGDRYEVVKSRPLHILAAYWDRLVIAGFTLLCSIAAAVMLIKGRRQIGAVILLISPHVYSVASHIVTHLEPRFLLPSSFCGLAAFAYVCMRGWREPGPRAVTGHVDDLGDEHG